MKTSPGFAVSAWFVSDVGVAVMFRFRSLRYGGTLLNVMVGPLVIQLSVNK